MDKRPKQNRMAPNSFQVPTVLVSRLMRLLFDDELRVLLLLLSSCDVGDSGLELHVIDGALKRLAQYGVLHQVCAPIQGHQLWALANSEDDIDWNGLAERRRERDGHQSHTTRPAARPDG